MKRILFLLVICVSCKSSQPTAEVPDKNYDLLNALTESFVEAYEDDKHIKYFSLRRDGANGHFSSILERDFKKYFYDDEFNLIFKSGDLAYMKKQLDQPFSIDFSKINSRKVKLYASALSQEEALTGPSQAESSAELNTINFAISRPVFTQDDQWGLVYVLNESGISVDILKRAPKGWEFYRLIPIGIF